MVVRETATSRQLVELSQGLERLEDECRMVVDLIRTIHGAEDRKALRAGELHDALQRLYWELERDNTGAQPVRVMLAAE